MRKRKRGAVYHSVDARPDTWRGGVRRAAWRLAACSNPLRPAATNTKNSSIWIVSGSATVIVDASVPALVALRGRGSTRIRRARIDQESVRRLFEASGCDVVRVGQPWRATAGASFRCGCRRPTCTRSASAACSRGRRTRFAPDADGNFAYEQKVGASTSGTIRQRELGRQRAGRRSSSTCRAASCFTTCGGSTTASPDRPSAATS